MPDIEAAVIEAPEGGEETVETTPIAEETGTGAEEVSSESGSEQQKPDLTEKIASKAKINLLDVAKTQRDALNAINPALSAAVQKAGFELNGLYREFPGGLKEAVALKNSFSEFGGAEGVKELQSAVSDYSALESKFEKADPSFITDLADALPSSFSQIMPAGLEKWKAIDADGYNHTVARAIVDTLKPHGVQEALAAIHNAIDAEKGKEVRAELARLWNLFEGVKSTADKAPEKKVNPEAEKLSQREQDLAQREIQLNMKPIATEGKAQIQTILDREMGGSYQWDKTDPDVKQAVSERILAEVKNASMKDKTFSDEFERLKARGDWAGLSRHVKNFQERVTPTIIPKVARLFNVKPKGGPVIAGKKPVVAANGKTPERGFEKVSAQPKASQIDYAAMGRGADDMLLDRKAILKGGRKVIWD